MTVEINFGEPHFRIYIRTQEEEKVPMLLDIYAFLHDFNLLYEISRIATDPNYDYFFLSEIVFSRPDGLFISMRDEDRLRVEKMTKESPMELVTVLAAVPIAVGAIWGIVQILEKVVNFRLNRRKLKAEIIKLERENSEATEKLPSVHGLEHSVFLFENPRFLRARLEERGAMEYYDAVAGRLINSKIEIVEIDIQLKLP
jgi:hypothetical protein